jgi:hypothetical protein
MLFDEPLLTIEALDGAENALEKLLERPDSLLDPSGAEAKSTAESARDFVKLFFDAAHARCPPHLLKGADGLESMVVDGFELEQIWEELEMQNVPLRRHLRHSIKKLVKAPRGAVNISLPTVAQGDLSQKAREGGADFALTAKRKKPKKALQKENSAEMPDEECASPDVNDDSAEEEKDQELDDQPLEDGFFQSRGDEQICRSGGSAWWHALR